MIPVIRFSIGGRRVRPMKCSKCGKMIKLARGTSQFDKSLGTAVGGIAICGKCKKK